MKPLFTVQDLENIELEIQEAKNKKQKEEAMYFFKIKKYIAKNYFIFLFSQISLLWQIPLLIFIDKITYNTISIFILYLAIMNIILLIINSKIKQTKENNIILQNRLISSFIIIYTIIIYTIIIKNWI